jgi:transposase-like protein
MLAYWVIWRSDVDVYCRPCALCQSVKHGNAPMHGALQSYEPTSVGDRLHVDRTDLHPVSRQGSIYTLIAIDAFSRYLWCIQLKNKQAITVASALVDHVLRPFGSYNSLVTDQGDEFCK